MYDKTLVREIIEIREIMFSFLFVCWFVIISIFLTALVTEKSENYYFESEFHLLLLGKESLQYENMIKLVGRHLGNVYFFIF